MKTSVLDWLPSSPSFEATPEPLLKRARCAAERYGVVQVSRAVGVDRRRLEDRNLGDRPAQVKPGATPAYPRVEVSGGGPGLWRPFAELELPRGVKVRLYANGPETMGLLLSVCGAGGGQ